MHRLALASSFALIVAVAGCSNPPPACTLGSSVGCQTGELCEMKAGSSTGVCYAQLEIHGRVLDASTQAPLAGARVLALDANGAAISRVVVSGADGTYVLPVAAARDANGMPTSANVTLHASASGYQTFPTAPRTALPIDLATATTVNGHPTIMTSATDIALVPHAGSGITLSGSVMGSDAGGVLVVAEQGTAAVATAISDLDGSFVLYDVPAGMTHVTGLRAGLRITPVDVTAQAPGVDGIVLAVETGALGTVTGSVNIVNAAGGSTTSVILVVESTFVESAARGEAPAGLRAGDVSNSFTIANVPPGRYVVLAAFENDGLVRDPDMSIAGTAIQHIEVPAAGGQVPLSASFKVTGALAVVGPGADGVETITTAMPTFQWADDSSEDGYEVRVFDAFGNMVFEDTNVPSHTGGGSVSYAWTSASLMPGMIYQFRATSWRTGHTGTARTYISATEDLRGVFEYQP